MRKSDGRPRLNGIAVPRSGATPVACRDSPNWNPGLLSLRRDCVWSDEVRRGHVSVTRAFGSKLAPHQMNLADGQPTGLPDGDALNHFADFARSFSSGSDPAYRQVRLKDAFLPVITET